MFEEFPEFCGIFLVLREAAFELCTLVYSIYRMKFNIMVFLSQPILKPHFPIVYRIICCVFSKFSAVCVVSFSIEIALKEGKKGQVIFMHKKEGSLEKNVYK